MKYTNENLKEISFPLGGIGTGCIGLAGNGRLIDWEIFNRPNKGSDNGYSHIAVKVNDQIRILQSDEQKDLMGHFNGQREREIHGGYGYGPHQKTMNGLPHFRNCIFEGEFPIAKLTFEEEGFPGKVTLTAFNPFIPLDADNSSIPAAFFEVSYTNTGKEAVSFETAFTLCNPFAMTQNKRDGNTVTLFHAGKTSDDLDYGDLSLTAADPKAVQTYWYRGRWQDGLTTYWNQFRDGVMPDRLYTDAAEHKDHRGDHCTIVQGNTVSPGKTKAFRFVVSWNVPNNYNYWTLHGEQYGAPWKNYYATRFADSAASGRYALENWETLYKKTLEFKEALFASTLDEAVLDAASSTLSVLKSPTVYRLQDGSFWGFEGNSEHFGSCHGTCQHVWNYAYALCFLFPELERSIRDLEFDRATDENGGTAFRVVLPLTEPQAFWFSCVDGQMGCIIKTYREWKISGDTEWLKRHWPQVKKVLAYAWSPANPHAWDRNKDGILEGRQHHTLDMELYGPSSWLEGFYMAALKAAAEMAEFLGEDASEYLELYEKARAFTNKELFNGEYFYHQVNLNDRSVLDGFEGTEDYWNEETGEIKYQIGEGSSIDQLTGQWHADLCGLGELFEPELQKIALQSMFKYNFKPSMRNWINLWRNYALNDDAGAVMCDYPAGYYQPKIPITYSSETMHGFEYTFTGLLVSEGMLEEALKVVKGVRDRYQGHNRNPWNEMECGSNYARSMAAFALLPLYSGFTFDLPHETIGFDPKLQGEFQCLFSLGTGWGMLWKNAEKAGVKLHSGSLTLSKLVLPFAKEPKSLKIDEKDIPFTAKNGTLSFKTTTAAKEIEVIYA
ncbi:MAG: hypothetical protein IJP27_08565 [Clostridia bacterium]|nr:hypothetical protein [Clostridia bacterium]